MQPKTGTNAPLQPLPNDVQERVWAFVREQIRAHEDATGEKVPGFEIHLTATGQIEVEVLSKDIEVPPASDDSPDNQANRLKQREELHHHAPAKTE